MLILIVMLIRTSPVTLLKIDSTTDGFPAILKSLLTLKGSICSGVYFQYSYEQYIEQMKLLKTLIFPRVPNTPEKYMKSFFLEASMFQIVFQNALKKHFSWSLFLLKSKFLDCKRILAKKGQLYKAFFFSFFSFVIATRNVSVVQFLEKRAPLRMSLQMFSEVLLQLFQSTLTKRSMTEFGSVLRPFFAVFRLKVDFKKGHFVEIFADEIMTKKSPMGTCPGSIKQYFQKQACPQTLSFSLF